MYGPYNKVFRAECIGDTRFKPYKYGEDLLFVFETLRNAKAVCIDDYVGYHYVERAGSAVKSGFSLSKLDYLKAAREVSVMRAGILSRMPERPIAGCTATP